MFKDGTARPVAKGDESEDAWVKRDPTMWRHGKWNAECPVLLLGNEYATPQNRFFIRSHGPVPRDLDAKTHRVEICGLVDKPSSFTITEMKAKFPVRELWSALVCSGSRRNELNLIKHGGGHIDWHSSVANAKWTGVYLRDVLLHCGVSQDFSVARNVEFEGCDWHSEGYQTSIPFSKAIDINGDCILAWAMNDEELHPDHGYPLRILIPGFTGARSCKWLRRISVQTDETMHPMHHKYYKVFAPHILSAADNMREYADTPPLMEINTNSIIFEPVNRQPAKSGPLHVRGYAYSGGGRPVTRVEISLDNAATWLQCKLAEQRLTDGGRQYAWTFWETDVDFDPAMCKELVLRAWDGACNTQSASHQWNYNGMMNNAYFRVKVMPSDGGGFEFIHPSTWMKDDPLNASSGEGQTAAPAKAAPSAVADLPPWDGKLAIKDADGKRQFNAQEVALHNKEDDMWVIIDGNVYDVTTFLPRHPGGADPIKMYGGMDSTAEFDILHDRKVLRTHLARSQNLGTVKDYRPQGDAKPRTAKGAQVAQQKAGAQQGMNITVIAVVGLVCALLGHFIPSLLLQ